MKHPTFSLSALAALAAFTVARPALAVRPFITDDARTVGGHCAQLETWVRADRHSTQHWILGALGPVGPVELTLGGVYGVSYDQQPTVFSATGPVFQAKVLVHPTVANRPPGVALVAGVIPPLHVGRFGASGWDGFGYVALTQSLFDRDRVLIHVNAGVYATTADVSSQVAFTWGVGSQIRMVGGLHAVFELFSGDPYAGTSGGATQAGLRHFLSDNVQIDGTVGVGVWGDAPMPPWGSLGLRIASNPLW